MRAQKMGYSSRSSFSIFVLTLILSLLFNPKTIGSNQASIMYAQTRTQSGYLYGSVVSSPGKILKVDLAAFTLQDTLILTVNQQAHALLLTNNSLFVGTLGSPATILQIRLSDFKEINKITLPTGFNNVMKFDTDDTFLYASLSTGQVVRLTFSPLSIVDWLTAYNNGRVEGAQYYNGYLYVTSFAGFDAPAYLEKFDAATLSFVGRIQLSFKRAHLGLRIGNVYYIASNGIEGQTGSTAGVMEINLDEFREVRNKAFDTGDGKGAADEAIKYGEYLFLNGDVQPLGRVYRTRISDFSWTYINVTGPRLSAPEGLDNYGYFPSVNQLAQPPGPAQIFKVNLDTFQQEDVLTFSGEPGIPQVVIQPVQPAGKVTLTGTITDINTAAPVSGATIIANGYTAVSNQTGGYVITNLPLGSYTVSVNAVGYETKNTTLNASSSIVYTVDFRIKKITVSSTITGTVLEAKTGNPIMGASVTANGYATTTNSTGRYNFALRPGNYTVKVNASGYKESNQTIDARAEGAYTVNFTLTALEDNTPDVDHPFPINELVAAIVIFASVITIAVWFSKRRKRSR